jgi:ribosomal protein L16 Arg81 hydroxylase
LTSIIHDDIAGERMVPFDPIALSCALVGGISQQEFDATVREKRPARFPGAFTGEQLGQLCGLSHLEELLNTGAVGADWIDVFQRGNLIRLTDMLRKSGRSVLQAVLSELGHGATIRVRDLDKADPRLRAFIAEVRRQFAAHAQINVYLTPPGQAGFPPHFDITDVFVLQCSGEKDWKVFDDYSNRVDLPAVNTNWDPDRFKPSDLGNELTLAPGDVLYLPRGVMHAASCQARESLHLTISIAPLTFADLISRVVESMQGTEVALRRRVPWSPGGTGDEAGMLERETKELILRLAERVNIAELLKEEASSLAPQVEGSTGTELESTIAGLRDRLAGKEPAPASPG